MNEDKLSAIRKKNLEKWKKKSFENLLSGRTIEEHEKAKKTGTQAYWESKGHKRPKQAKKLRLIGGEWVEV